MMLWMQYELVAADVEELLSDESFDALTISANAIGPSDGAYTKYKIQKHSTCQMSTNAT